MMGTSTRIGVWSAFRGRAEPDGLVVAISLGEPVAAGCILLPIPVARPDCQLVERRIEGVAGMTIRYECQDCGAAMKIKDKLAGKKGHCPKCKTEFTIPGSSAKKSSFHSTGMMNSFPTFPARRTWRSLPRCRAGASRTTDAYAEAFKSTSNTAGDLLKQAAASTKNKNKKGQKLFGLDEREDPDKAKFDGGETFKYVVLNALGPMAGIAVLVMLVYWISSSVLKDSGLPKLATVSGTILLDNQPLANAQVEFSPQPEEKRGQCRLPINGTHERPREIHVDVSA